jgi:hypothetical protein
LLGEGASCFLVRALLRNCYALAPSQALAALYLIMSQARQVRRSNHFVAAGYLAAFTDGGTRKGVLQAYRRSEPRHPLEMTAESVAREKELYTRRVAGGVLDDTIERRFAEDVEGPFLTVRNRFLVEAAARPGWRILQLPEKEREAVALYLAVQHLRTPTERDAATWLSDLAAIPIVREVMAPGGAGRTFFQGLAGRELLESDFAAIASLLTNIASHNARAQGHWLQVGLKLAPRLASLITGMEWYLVGMPEGFNLPTCDMPLVCVTRGAEHGSFELGGGWAQGGFEATLALSPSVVLFLTRAPEDSSFLGTDTFARSVRLRTVAFAQNWVYSRTVDPGLADLLAVSSRPSYRIEMDGQYRDRSEPPASLEADLQQRGSKSVGWRYGSVGREQS